MDAITYTDPMPLWLLYILSAGIVILSIEIGWRLGDNRRKHNKQESKAPISAMVGSTLGLLAFLLAFTFGMAASRFDTRKQNVLQEANTIGTTYLRTDFLPDAYGEESRKLLREYTALHASGASAITGLEGQAKTARLHNRLWEIASTVQEQSDTRATGLYVQTLNEMIDMDTTRRAGLRNRIPDSIWLMLIVITIFSMAAMGYQEGMTGARSWPVTILLTIVFTTVILLIADLDRPQTGLIQVSQQPLLDLLNSMGGQ